MRKFVAFLFAVVAVLGFSAAPSNSAAPHHYVATSHFTKANDVVGHPRGVVIAEQNGNNGVITVHGHLSGLTASTVYVAVEYKDPLCLFDPTVTAFPSGSFTTDAKGRVTFNVTLNPKVLNPVGTFDVKQSKSTSIRRVIVNAAGQNVPSPLEEGCSSPVVK